MWSQGEKTGIFNPIARLGIRELMIEFFMQKPDK
jgi:hypothetical protein